MHKQAPLLEVSFLRAVGFSATRISQVPFEIYRLLGSWSGHVLAPSAHNSSRPIWSSTGYYVLNDNSVSWHVDGDVVGSHTLLWHGQRLHFSILCFCHIFSTWKKQQIIWFTVWFNVSNVWQLDQFLMFTSLEFANPVKPVFQQLTIRGPFASHRCSWAHLHTAHWFHLSISFNSTWIQTTCAVAGSRRKPPQWIIIVLSEANFNFVRFAELLYREFQCSIKYFTRL